MKEVIGVTVFCIICVLLAAAFASKHTNKPRQLTRLEAPKETGPAPIGATHPASREFKVLSGVCMIGYRAGEDVAWSDVSHVFIGPMAGTGYKHDDERPLVEFRNKSGEIMFTIDRNGKYKRNVTEEEIVKEFENYDFQGREYMRKNPRPEYPTITIGAENYEGIVD